MKNIKGLLIDIDGVLLEDNHAIKGSVGHFNELRKKYKIRLLTNTTTKTVHVDQEPIESFTKVKKMNNNAYNFFNDAPLLYVE